MKNVVRVIVFMSILFFVAGSSVDAKARTKKTSRTAVKKTSTSTSSGKSLKVAKAGYEGEWFAGGYLGDWVGAQGGYWLNNNWVGQLGLGYDFSAGALGVALDGQYYLKDNLLVDVPEGKLYFYGDLGLKVGFADDIQARIRTLAGAAYFLREHPISLHAEVGPSWKLTQGFSVGIAGGIGLRYHFQ